MTETEVYKPNCCIECTFADECFSEERIKCADYEIAIKEYDRGLADGLKVGCVKGRELEKENAELKAQIEKMKCCKNCKYSQYISCPILHAKQCLNHSKWELAE